MLKLLLIGSGVLGLWFSFRYVMNMEYPSFWQGVLAGTLGATWLCFFLFLSDFA